MGNSLENPSISFAFWKSGGDISIVNSQFWALGRFYNRKGVTINFSSQEQSTNPRALNTTLGFANVPTGAGGEQSSFLCRLCEVGSSFLIRYNIQTGHLLCPAAPQRFVPFNDMLSFWNTPCQCSGAQPRKLLPPVLPQSPVQTPTFLWVLEAVLHMLHCPVHFFAVTDVQLHRSHSITLHGIQLLGATLPLVLGGRKHWFQSG